MKKEETFANSTVQWTTLAHNGVLLPPEYTPLPHSVHFIYDGQPIQLDLEAEEAATLYAVHCVGTGLHTKNPVSVILPSLLPLFSKFSTRRRSEKTFLMIFWRF